MFVFFSLTKIQSNYYRTNFFFIKTKKNTDGEPRGRGLAAPESEFPMILLLR